MLQLFQKSQVSSHRADRLKKENAIMVVAVEIKATDEKGNALNFIETVYWPLRNKMTEEDVKSSEPFDSRKAVEQVQERMSFLRNVRAVRYFGPITRINETMNRSFFGA